MSKTRIFAQFTLAIKEEVPEAVRHANAIDQGSGEVVGFYCSTTDTFCKYDA